ncbi:nucleotidyltransferase family protein [Chloroflexales bacterium ZM16-3]|nr:nucleotidyltransferase family protein [Chloroflexales bacterium ZM16-3]
MAYGILLAAGTSSRMGKPKQLLEWGGRPLVRHVAEQALASQMTGLVIVIGAAANAVRAALVGLDGPVLIVENPDYASGQASSLRAGLSALPGTARAAMVLLVDQPLVTPALIDQIIAGYGTNPQALALIPSYRGRRGNPVLLAHGLFEELRTLKGDVGARDVLARHAAEVAQIAVDDPAVTTDMDTPEDYMGIQ